MSRPKVLIVGCGAVGLTQGYHISAGADCTFLVRPGRKPAFLPPKRLYSYKDDQLYTFSSYRVIESVSEVKGETFTFILDTLDGHTARSEQGTSTIRSVGDLLEQPQNIHCFVAYDAVGLDIEDHYTHHMRIPLSRIMLVASMLAHQPTPQISIPVSADKDLIAKADMLYTPALPSVGLVVGNTQPSLTKQFEAIYSANGKLSTQRIPAFFVPMFPLLVMAQLVVWNLDRFGPFDQLRRNSELWALLLRAQAEILRLPRFGWTGWLLSFILSTSWATEKFNWPTIECAKPLLYHEFNAFHHGGKVAKQDLRTLEDILNEGEKAGRKMEALREVVRRANQLY